MKSNLTINPNVSVNNISILSVVMLIAGMFLSAASHATSVPKNDSLNAATSKTENLSVVFSGSNSKAILQWDNNDSTTSHYVIERSTDGVNYNEAAVIFTPEDGANTIKKFRYSDKIEVANKKIMYYRLKLVNNKNEVKYSKVITVAVDKVQSDLI